MKLQNDQEMPTRDSPQQLLLFEEKSNKKLKYYLTTAIAAILILLFILGLIPRLLIWGELENETEVINPLSVGVILAKPNKEPIELNLPSITTGINTTPIWARTNGYIKKFYVDIGDQVKEGQLMVDIETPEIVNELSQAKANLTTAIARFEIAKITATRWQELLSSNAEAVSTQEVDVHKYSFSEETAAVEAAYANVQRLENILGFNKVYAPFPGIVTTRNIDIGTLISAGSQGNLVQMFQVDKIDIIRVFVSVPQPYFRSIKVGGKTEVSIGEFPDKVFEGIIARTSGSLDQATRTLLTEVHVNNKKGHLIPGLYAEVKFKLTPAFPSYIIPSTALIIRTGHPLIGVVNNDGIVHLKKVKIERDYGRTLAITSGIKENDKIITNPNEKIVEGVKVTIATVKK